MRTTDPSSRKKSMHRGWCSKLPKIIGIWSRIVHALWFSDTGTQPPTSTRHTDIFTETSTMTFSSCSSGCSLCPISLNFTRREAFDYGVRHSPPSTTYMGQLFHQVPNVTDSIGVRDVFVHDVRRATVAVTQGSAAR